MKRRICSMFLLVLMLFTLLPQPADAVLATPHISTSNVVSNGIYLRWAPVAGAAKYRVFRLTNGRWRKIGDTAAANFTDTTAKVGQSYTYTVRCIASDAKSFTSRYDPVGVTLYRAATPVISTAFSGNSGVSLRWNAVTGVKHYRVYRKAGSSWVLLSTVKSNSFVDTTVTAGNTYTYTVRAVSPDNRHYLSYFQKSGTSVAYLAAPRLAGISAEGTVVNLRWKGVAGAAQYRVFHLVNGSWKKMLDTTSTSCQLTGFKPYESCTFTVRCLSKDGRQYTSGYMTAGLTISTGEQSRIVCIDPGHQRYGNSAKEPIGPGSSTMKAKVTDGATGDYTGKDEYVLTLEVSLKLQTELQNRGYQVVMTRTTHDVNLSNKERADIANRAKADVFLRIHADDVDSHSVNGIMTIAPTSSNPYLTSANIKASQKLSDVMLDSMVAATGAKRRSVMKTDSMSGINWSQVPVTIIEMGLMSNEREDRLMVTDAYQWKLAKGMADGVDRYFQENG